MTCEVNEYWFLAGGGLFLLGASLGVGSMYLVIFLAMYSSRRI